MVTQMALSQQMKGRGKEQGEDSTHAIIPRPVWEKHAVFSLMMME
jgi:hypothetical protein